jgi:hypothetical protein
MVLLNFVTGIVGIIAGASIVQKNNVTTGFLETTGGGLLLGIGGGLLFEAMGIDTAAQMTESFGGGVVLGGAGKAVVSSLSS